MGLDHFHEFGFCLLNSGDVFKAHFDFARLVVDLRAALAESERARRLTNPTPGVTGDKHKEQDRHHPWKQKSPP